MANPSIPAPERDLQNVDPEIPPASREPSTITRTIFGSLAVGFGIALLMLGVAAAVFQASPVPQHLFASEELTAAILASVSGLCLIGCGVAIFRRSGLLMAVLFALSILCGVAASFA